MHWPPPPHAGAAGHKREARRMARFTDYATTRQERLWVVDESPFNTLAQPGPHHQVILIPGTTLPPVLFAYTPSEERRPTPDIADLIQRKKTPSWWFMPVYAKFGSAQARPPSWSLMAEKAFGQMVITWTIVDHPLLTGKTATVRIDGTDTAPTEGAE